MTKSEKEKRRLLEDFGRLDPVNRKDVLHHLRAVYVTQENTKRELEKQHKMEKTA